MSLGTGRRIVRSPEVVVALTRSVLVGRAGVAWRLGREPALIAPTPHPPSLSPQ
jgi:hypothetical protein